MLSSLSSLILPVTCIRCESEGAVICRECTKYLCDPITFGGRFVDTRNFPAKIASCLPYSQVVAGIVLGAKDDGNERFQQIIVDSLLRARALFPPKLILVPIPSTRQARLRRGRDFAQEISKTVALASGDQVRQLLISNRRSAPQKSLNARQRIENMEDAFKFCWSHDMSKAPIREQVQDLPILIVDDVLTTGATMRAALRALSAGGATCIGAISAAYSPNWKVSRLGY